MRGLSLLELVCALVVAGLLLGLAVPRAIALRDRLVVERHTAGILAAWQRARTAAMLGSRRAVLHVQPERLSVWTVRRNGDSSLVWAGPGPARDGVLLTAAVPRVVFAPTGLTVGVANGRYDLDRGRIRRTVVAARLGRVRVERRRSRGRTSGPRAP